MPSGGGSAKKTAKSKLDAPTQSLLKLIFDNDMFRDTMIKLDIGKNDFHVSQINLSVN